MSKVKTFIYLFSRRSLSLDPNWLFPSASQPSTAFVSVQIFYYLHNGNENSFFPVPAILFIQKTQEKWKKRKIGRVGEVGKIS
jgi:hypothetical protein